MIDARGIVTHQCLSCESRQFLTIVSFDDYDIASWSLDGECVNCGDIVTLPCPLDRP